MMKTFFLVTSAFLVLTLSGCALRPYQMQVEQGVTLTQGQVSQLQVGMTEDQVSFLLGTPNVVDPYHPNAWYYIYTNQENHQPMTQSQLIVNFDSSGKVASFQEK